MPQYKLKSLAQNKKCSFDNQRIRSKRNLEKLKKTFDELLRNSNIALLSVDRFDFEHYIEIQTRLNKYFPKEAP